MIYLDYSATTPINSEVLKVYNEVSTDFFANTNSIHSLGVKSKRLLEMAVKETATFLNVYENEIIFTSGATESNNLAIKGVMEYYKKKGNKIIIGPFEHSSVKEASKNYNSVVLKANSDGSINLEDLKNKLDEETVMVSISLIDSELGIKQNIEEIAKIIKEYNDEIIFHVDVTQGAGKIKFDLTNIDLASMSAHKFYGPKGVGVLYKSNLVNIKSLFDGGQSQSLYRAGTPALPLIVSFTKALKLADENNNYEHVLKINKKIKEHFKKYDDILINSTDLSIPYVLNFSLKGIKPETFVHALEEENVYISTKSACSSSSLISDSVLNLTNDEKRASSSLRISLSYLTSEEEIERFLKIFDKKYKEVCLCKK